MVCRQAAGFQCALFSLITASLTDPLISRSRTSVQPCFISTACPGRHRGLRPFLGSQTLTVKPRLLPGRNTVQLRGDPPRLHAEAARFPRSEARPEHYRLKAPVRRFRSSVIERCPPKAEVAGEIPAGSTIPWRKQLCLKLASPRTPRHRAAAIDETP